MRSSLLLLLVAIPAHANPPENLDRIAISDGVAKVKAKVQACGNANTSGTVKIKVDVAPSGNVTSATIMATPEQAVGECVAAAMKTATFRATQKGGTFSYPFVFGSGKAPPPPPPSNPPPPPPPPPSGDTLDRAAISDGVAKVKQQVIACGDTSKARGTVKVKVEVAPSGVVAAASVIATPDPVLGDCVVAVMRQATFRKTTKGGTFSYPFVF